MNRIHIDKTNAVIISVAILLSVVMLNAIASQAYLRFDLTGEKIYTLSDVSKQAAAGLEQPVEVRAFISPDLPPPYHRLEQTVEEMLTEYEAASGGMLRYEIIAPGDDRQLEQLARGYGVEPVTIDRRTATEYSHRQVYKGVAFVQGPHQEVIPELQMSAQTAQGDYEYEFTRALMHLQHVEPRTVGVLTGLGGPADQPGFEQGFRRLFTETYGELLELVTVDANDLTDIGADTLAESFAALVAINVGEGLGENQLTALDGFIARGGNFGWFQSGSVVDEARHREQLRQIQAGQFDRPPVMPRTDTDTALVDYFASMGVRFGVDAVVDRERAISQGRVPTARGMVPASHPALFPIDDIARELPFARHVSTLFLPAPSAVDIEVGALPEGAQAHRVLNTAESSVRLSEAPARWLYDDLIQPARSDDRRSHTVAVALQGPLAIESPPEDVEPARVLVVGSGDFIAEVPEVGYRGELTLMGVQFFLNSVEWLAQHDELADIRGKSMPELVADVPADTRRSILFINIALVPALFATIGVFMMIRRRRRKEELST